MNTKQQAFQDLKRFSKMFKSFVQLADDLDDVSSIEDARDRAETRLSAARAEEVGLEASLATAKAELQAAQEQGRAAATQAALIEASARSRADEKAQAIIQAANDGAMNIATIAKQEAAKLIADAKAQGVTALHEANNNAATVRDKTKSAQEYLKQLEAAIADKSNQLQTLTDKIAKMKNSIASLG